MRMPTRALPLLLVWLLVWLLAAISTAQAAGSAVVQEPELSGSISEAARQTLDAAIADALKEQGFTLAREQERDSILLGESQLRDCHTPLCLERLGRLLDVQLVAEYRVAVKSRIDSEQARSDFELELTLFDVEVGAPGATVKNSCPRCTTAKAAGMLFELTKQAVFENAARSRGAIEIHSKPTNATVFVDGTELGITPYKRGAFAGPHKLVVRHTGYRSQQVDLEVEEGKKRRLDLTLIAGSDPVDVAQKPLYKKWWFWVAISGAAVAAGAITAGAILGTRSDLVDRMHSANHISF